MRLAVLVVSSVAIGLVVKPGSAQEPRPVVCSMDQLVRMDRCDLLALYAGAEAGPIPHGYTPGRAIYKPGRPLTPFKAQLTSKTVWQGKVFHEGGNLMNMVFGKEAIHCDVYRAESWYDGKPSIIIDYANAGKAFARYRDEIRQVAPGLYLGLMYERTCPEPKLKMFFTLDARCGCR